MASSSRAARALRGGALALAAALALAGCSAGAAPPPEAAPDVPAAAAPADDAPFGIVGDTPDGRVRVALAPGGTAELAFRVVNAAAAKREFALRAADALAAGALAPAGAAPEGVGAWLTAPAPVVVRPRESAAAVATIRVPAGTAPGRYAGALVASPAHRAATPDGTGAALAYEVAARVTVVVRP